MNAPYQPTLAMERLFERRNAEHISLVKKNLLLMEGYLGLDINALQQRAAAHDASKYDEPERTAYTWMTWMYYCKFNNIVFSYPLGIDTIVFHG